MSNVAVVLLNWKGQILTRVKLIFWDQAMASIPVVCDKCFVFHADLLEQFLAGYITPVTQNPGHGSPLNRVIGSPNPELI